MKPLSMLVAALAALFAGQAVADDGQIPQATLQALGLGRMQVVSDAQGMQVRGRQSAFVSVRGTSLIFGQLMTPDTLNFVAGSSANSVNSNGETSATGTLTATSAPDGHLASLHLNLEVTINTDTFTGNIGTFAHPSFALGTGSVSVTLP